MKPDTIEIGRLVFAFSLAQRVLLAVVGGYFLSVAWAMLGAWLLSQLLLPSEAAMLAAMLAFLLYLVVLIWVFAEQRLARLWALLGVGGGLSWALSIGLGS